MELEQGTALAGNSASKLPDWDTPRGIASRSSTRFKHSEKGYLVILRKLAFRSLPEACLSIYRMLSIKHAVVTHGDIAYRTNARHRPAIQKHYFLLQSCRYQAWTPKGCRLLSTKLPHVSFSAVHSHVPIPH